MPTYAYRCQSCGVQFEKLQKFADKPLTRCPECRKGQVRRLLQPSAIVFKGSGWYATDNRSASGKGGKKSDSAESSGDSKTKSDTKTESKTESKAESKAESKTAAAKSDD